MSRPFTETLNYSSVNEDWRCEVEALKLRPHDHVLCVTGSGARALVLLAAEDVRITAIDAAPAQNHLLRLLVAALRQLPAAEALGFIGLTDRPAAERLACFDRLDLPVPARDWWAGHRRDVGLGVLYRGRFEKHFRFLSRVMAPVRGRTIKRLLAFDNIEEQREFVRTEWDTWWWRRMYGLAMHPLISRLLYGDPAFYAHAAVPVGQILYGNMTEALCRVPARDSFLIAFLLTGRLPATDLPPHLTEDGIARILPRLDNLDIVDADITSHLAGAVAPRYDRFSLSDVPSYMGKEEFAAFLRVVLAAAAPGARIVLRQFLTRYEVPDDIAPRLEREPELETRLAIEDRGLNYQFVIADVKDVGAS